MQIRTMVGVLAVLALGLGTLPSSAADTAQRALQGYSRTESLQNLCGDCTAEKFAQCGNQIEGPTFDDQGNLYIVSIADGDTQEDRARRQMFQVRQYWWRATGPLNL